MCQYKSAIVLPLGDLVHSDATDRHEDLILLAGLTDTTRQPHFVRIEYTGSDLTDIDTYALKVDQDWLPAWWDAAMVEDVTRRMRARCVASIVREHRAILCGGVWAVGGAAVVDRVVSARIVSVRGSATIRGVWGSATITDVGGSATIRDVWDSATITHVGGSATVMNVGDSATIRGVWGSATITDVGGSATIRVVWDSATITHVGGSATIRDVWDSATITDVGGSATIRDDHRVAAQRREGGAK